MNNRAKYQLARGKVAFVAENLGYHYAVTLDKVKAIRITLGEIKVSGKDISKDNVCRIARQLGYPISFTLGEWVSKETGEVL